MIEIGDVVQFMDDKVEYFGRVTEVFRRGRTSIAAVVVGNTVYAVTVKQLKLVQKASKKSKRK